MERWVRKDARVYHDAHCLLCGACYGICKGERRVCRISTCLACGSAQCSVNGLGRGQCGVCNIGLLTGWSGTDRMCQYKGCTKKAVVCADGAQRYRCHDHIERGKWTGYLVGRMAERERYWAVKDDAQITEVR